MAKYVNLKADMEGEWRIVEDTSRTVKAHSMGKVEFFPELTINPAFPSQPGVAERRIAPAAVALGEGLEFAAFIHEGIVSDDKAFALIIAHLGDGSIEGREVRTNGNNAYERMVAEVEAAIDELLEELD